MFITIAYVEDSTSSYSFVAEVEGTYNSCNLEALNEKLRYNILVDFLAILCSFSVRLKGSQDDAIFSSISPMIFGRIMLSSDRISHMRNATNSFNCPHDAPMFRRLRMVGINLSAKTFFSTMV